MNLFASVHADMLTAVLNALEWMYAGMPYHFQVGKSHRSIFLLYTDAPELERQAMNRFISGLLFAWAHPQPEITIEGEH